MSVFSNLGDQLGVPLIQQTVSTAANLAGDVASRISNFATSQFGVASPAVLTQEAVSKIASSDLTKNFSFVSTSASAASSAAGLVSTALVGTPAALLPKNSKSAGSTNALKVIISQTPAIAGQLNTVTFSVMPRISESGGAEYDTVQPTHHPGGIQKYRTSSPREWGITAKLIARNVAEATQMLNIMNMIRSWRMPFYGNGTANNFKTSKYLGAPPPILTLTAYGSGAIGPIKCVMTHYNWDWPDDIDYIHTENGNPMPVMMDVSLSLTETWSPAEFSGFDLVKYRAGNLGSLGAFQNTSMLPNVETSTTSSSSSTTTTSSSSIDRSVSTTISSMESTTTSTMSSVSSSVQSVTGGVAGAEKLW